MLLTTKRAKAKQVKKEQRKRAALMKKAEASSEKIENLKEEVDRLLRVRQGKAKQLKAEKQKLSRLITKVAAAGAGGGE